MSSKIPRPYTKFTRIFLVLLWMAQIFALSSHSNPADILPKFLIRWLWDTLIFGQRLFFLLGPISHLVNFGVLAFILARAFFWKTYFNEQRAVFIFIISFLYGLSDEIHQLFIPTRTFQIRDLFVNSLGALFGLGVYTLYCIRCAQKAREESLLLWLLSRNDGWPGTEDWVNGRETVDLHPIQG